METLGTFKDVESAARAVDSLVKAGFAEETITSLTSVPYPDGVIVRKEGPRPGVNGPGTRKAEVPESVVEPRNENVAS